MTKSLWLLVAVLIVLAGWNYLLDAQGRRDASTGPFRIVVQQTEPPVTLIEHIPTKACFVAYAPGGIVLVDDDVCRKSAGFPIPPIPIIPPPLSPER